MAPTPSVAAVTVRAYVRLSEERKENPMSPSISVFGLGYVGTVTAACLAHKGHNVIGVDLSSPKVEAMQAGRSPIVEPNLGDLISEGHKTGRLHATSDSEYAVLHSDISFLCVGTPSLRNGKLDLGHIEPVCREIGQVLKKKNGFHLDRSAQHRFARDRRDYRCSDSGKIGWEEAWPGFRRLR